MKIIQAPMAGAQDAELAIAVCRAGGIGSLPAAMLSFDQLQNELQKLQTQLNSSAFYNLNFFAHQTPTISDLQYQRWLDLLAPYLEEYGLRIEDIPQGRGREPFNEASLSLVEKFRPPIVSFHFGLPDDKLLGAVKATGAQIWSSATTVAEALYLESKGVDAIIAQGFEAGGHRGMFLNKDLSQQVGTLALLPNIRKAVNCTVIAAGGISDALTMAYAKAMGADAVQVGTAFLLANEAKITPEHKAALQSPAAQHTVITNLLSGGYARGIPNRFMQDVGAIHADALPFPMASLAIGLLNTAATKQGKTDFRSLWAGQNAILTQPGSASEIILRLQNG